MINENLADEGVVCIMDTLKINESVSSWESKDFYGKRV
jgi:hypothetical protein